MEDPLTGRPELHDLSPAPRALAGGGYSFVDAKNVIHVASVHEYVAAEKTYKTVAGSGGVSSGPSELEGVYGWNWARTIWSCSSGVVGAR